MTGRIRYLSIVLISYMGLPPAGHALQVLEAADHAELEAEISATAVNRVALDNDRIARVVQSPGGLIVEHDPARGDIYVRAGSTGAEGARSSTSGALDDVAPVTLYLGTERGLTYRLRLTVAERDSAQILIRNASVAPGMARGDWSAGAPADAYASDLVYLIRAAARGEPPPGYEIFSGAASGRHAVADGGHEVPVTLLETWRGRRYAVRVLKVATGAGLDAEALAARPGARVLAAWVSGEPVPAGSARRGAVVVDTHGGAGTVR